MKHLLFWIILVLSLFCLLLIFSQCAVESVRGELAAGQLYEATRKEEQEKKPEEKVITVKRTDTITIDYYEDKVYVARYTHFLKNHPRYDKYSGQADFFRKSPRTKAWIDHKRELVIVHYGEDRYDCSLTRYKYTICHQVKDKLLYWEKRLKIKERVEAAGGKW
jgi:hypothetical protein